MSADANGLRDAASHPVDLCVVHKAGRRVWSTNDDRRSTLKALHQRLSITGRQVSIAYNALGDAGCAVAKFSKSKVWDGQCSRGENASFCMEIPQRPKTQFRIGRGKHVSQTDPSAIRPPVPIQYRRVTDAHADTRRQHMSR